MISEWEFSLKKNDRNKNNTYGIDKSNKNINGNVIMCFTCEKEGPIKYNCIRNKTKQVKCFKYSEICHYSNKCITKKFNKIKINHPNKLEMNNKNK
ncbi:hypothetical protein H311_01649 [Anncaliia algerae PRA109]|nr:hypothetical protein H311_01649 [Anncaliia algerae PRA109]